MASIRELWQKGALRTRLLTAGILIGGFLVIGLISSVSCDSRWLLVNVAFLAVVLAGFEFARFAAGSVIGWAFLPYLAMVTLSPVATFLYLSFRNICSGAFEAPTLLLSIVLFSLVALMGSIGVGILRGGRDISKGKEVLLELPIAVLLVGSGGSIAIALASLPDSYRYVFWLVLVVSLNDTAAYLGGSKIGGPKLAPQVSPGKTISGSIAGVVVGTIGGVAGSLFLPGKHDWMVIAIASFFIILASQLGDLSKSYLKRLHGVKDSGNILPGHGGILDRIDGILGSAPVFMLYLVLVGTIRC